MRGNGGQVKHIPRGLLRTTQFACLLGQPSAAEYAGNLLALETHLDGDFLAIRVGIGRSEGSRDCLLANFGS